MAQPAGTSFLGSKATSTLAHIGSLENAPVEVIIDTGSDITLVSAKYLQSKVTGSAKIDGFIALDFFFDTPQGSVQLGVEAYVVKGMAVPFILGNDF